MPTYRIKTDQGEFDVEADKEPTHEEVLAALAGSSSAPQTVAASAPASQKPAATGDWGSSTIEPGPSAEFGGSVGLPQVQGSNEMARANRRVVDPVAAATPYAAAALVTGGGLPLAEAIGARAIAGGGAYLASQGIRGETPKLGELAKNMILSGAPVPSPKAAGLIAEGGMRNMALGAGTAAATVGTANYAEQALDQNTLAPDWDQYKKSLTDAVLPAIINASALSVGGKLRQMQNVQAEADAGRAAAVEMGMKDPMLGDVLPKRYGVMQQKIVSIDPAMRAKQDASRAPMARAIFATVENAPQNEQIATQLQPIINKVDELDAAYAAAAKRMDEAENVAATAKKAANIDPAKRAEILTGVRAEQMKALSDKAKATIALTVGADTIGTQTGHAESVRKITSDLFETRSKIAGDMLADTGIPENAAIIGQNALYDAAKAALKHEADTVAGKAILETIKNWGSKTVQDAAATKQLSLEQLARKAALEGRELTQAEVAANLAPKGTLIRDGKVVGPVAKAAPAVPPDQEKFLTMDDFRNLRDAISDGLYSKGLENNMNKAERLASIAYHAMSDAHVAEIGKQFPDAVAPYQKFREFWAKTSQLRDSDFGRALLRGEIADSTVAQMANKLASGNVDEIKNFNSFVNLIRPMNKDVADAAMATMGSAIRNSFLEKAMNAYGVDYRELGNLLHRYAMKSDAPVPVELFRMGDAATIKGWTKALQEFQPHDLTPQAIQGVMESPQIQQALNVGGKDVPAQLSKAMATVAFTKRVNDAVALREAGLAQKAREAFVEANALARKAGVDAQAAQAAMKAAEENPLTGVFKGKGGYTLLNEAEKIDGQGTVTDLIANMKRGEARSFMDALRQQKPELAEMVERRLVANTLQSMIRTERNVPGQIYNLDVPKVRAFFEPLPGKDTDTRFSQLAAAIGQEKSDRLKKFALGIAKMDDASREAMSKIGMQPEAINAAEFVRTGQSGSIQSGRSLGSLLRQGANMVRTKRFNLASAMLLDDGAWNAFSRNSGDYAAALSELPPQRAYLLLQDARIMSELGKSDK